ncbi:MULTISPECIES: PHB depolymerase family esterase [Chelativorans]|uniref:Poly(3-hydroxybutyrate) depolymerase-like protein n=1 Tax=Chelativorans sp. (strain BNC1) TaxID=266779 RepID=Q11E96_CHESB|nr:MULTISPECIES: PHB depolymerase family esterase [Chelativorans]
MLKNVNIIKDFYFDQPRRAALAAALITTTFLGSGVAYAQSLETKSVTVGGRERVYYYYVPDNIDDDGFNPVVYALHDNGQSVEEFAEQSGWTDLADENGFAVVFPAAMGDEHKWGLNAAGEDDYLYAVSQHAALNLPLPAAEGGQAQGGRAGQGGGGAGQAQGGGRAEQAQRGGAGQAQRGGRGGPPTVPTWQPFHYLTGAGAGGTVAQAFVMNYPGIYASVATLDGAAYGHAYQYGDQSAQGYLLNQRGGKNPAAVWKQTKDEVPVAAWLFTSGEPTEREASQEEYWKAANNVAEAGESTTLGGLETTVYADPENPASQLLTTVVGADATYNSEIASAIWDNLFSRTARWPTSANGELGVLMPKAEVEQAFDVKSIDIGDLTYTYYVHVPSNVESGEGLPLLLSAHGARFPAWQFISQTNFHELGEKEGFVTVYLQGQGNRWTVEDPNGPDAQYVAAVIEQVAADYGIDRSRVYMHGFSFGSALTYMMSITRPDLFAAVAPTSGIGPMPEAVVAAAAEQSDKGLRIPMMIVYGSSDGGSSMDGMIPAQGVLRNAIDEMKAFNGIKTEDRTELYDSRNGEPYQILVPGADLIQEAVDERFPEGRFQNYAYSTDDGLNLLSFVWVLDMPHGQAPGQTDLMWDFLQQWQRNPDGSLRYLGD